MKILIVEDNEGLCKVLTALFVSGGHEVVGRLADGDGVEEKITQLRPDVLCLDYHLPGRDGLAILAAVNVQAPEVDVIFMTGSEEEGIEQRAADAGASGFIRKPFSQQQVLDEIREVAEVRQFSSTEQTRADTEASAAPASASAEARPATGGRRTAVIADDSGSVRMVLKGLLEENGLRVVQSVGNGSEAITAIRTHRPSVLCLDVNMPIMSGLEALPLVRELSPETVVVMVTGCADRAFVTQAASLGAKGYILKPLRPAYIENFVKKLFQ
jgi:DNA-binding NarL/FixJ family response regulator